MKKWLIEHFLPMWAKETVLRDNRIYRQEVARLDDRIDNAQGTVMYTQIAKYPPDNN